MFGFGVGVGWSDVSEVLEDVEVELGDVCCKLSAAPNGAVSQNPSLDVSVGPSGGGVGTGTFVFVGP